MKKERLRCRCPGVRDEGHDAAARHGGAGHRPHRLGHFTNLIASEAACAKGGSQVYLEPGEEMSMDEMLKSVVVSSANDCATALAEHVAGSESAFVGMMNQRAQELGLLDTNFVNCTGAGRCAGGRGAPDDGARHRRDLAGASEARPHPRLHDYLMDTVRGGEIRPFEHEQSCASIRARPV